MENEQTRRVEDANDGGTFGREYGPPPKGVERPALEAPPSWLSKLPGGNILLAGLICAGLVGVYVLKQNSGPETASAAEVTTQQRVDQALVMLKKSTPGITTKTSSLVEKFYYEARERQIALDKLERNPFLFELKQPDRTSVNDGSAVRTVTKSARNDDPARTLAMNQAGRLELMSTIVAGNAAGSSAIISDIILYTGNSIQGWVIEKIASDKVELCWQKNKEVKFVLQMPR